MPVAELRVLGQLEIVGQHGVVPVAPPKQRRLLAALAVAGGDTRSVDLLIDAIWPEATPVSARKLLQLYVSQLRKLLPSGLAIETQAGGYSLSFPARALDSERFEALVSQSDAARAADNPVLAISTAERALRLWRGPAYAEFVYDDFARAEASRLDELRLRVCEDRFGDLLALGRHAEVVSDLVAFVAEHPLREQAHGLAMRALYQCDRQTDALALYTAYRERLLEELGLEPALALRELHVRMLRQDPALAPATPVAAALGSLPAAVSALVGRERELALLDNALGDRETRLLVLTGAGGSGKSTLAIEAARRAVATFANGATVVDLAPLRDPRLVVARFAEAVGVTPAPHEDLRSALIATLAAQEMLVVVDNMEHVAEAAPLLVEIAAGAPNVTMMVTSRVVLHVSGEHVFPVGPLDEHDALELFERRARAHDPGFEKTDANREAINQICARIDRLPLAIELAATRVRSLTIQALLERLDARLPLLTGGPRDLPGRQRTLRATIGWSYGLLDPVQQQAIAALAVFRAAWTNVTAERVCGVGLDTLASLLDHSLVVRHVGPDADKWRMLETIHEFATERLAEQVALDEHVRRRHAEWILELALSAHLTGLDAVRDEVLEPAPERVLAARDELRAALDWAHVADPRLAAAIVAALEVYWVAHAPDEGRRHIERLLVVDHALPASLRAQLLQTLGGVIFPQGDFEGGEKAYCDAIEIFRELGMTEYVVGLEARLAIHAAYRGDPEAIAAIATVRALNESPYLPGVEAQLRSALAALARMQGRAVEAVGHERAAVALARSCGFRLWECWSLCSLAEISLTTGLLPEANEAARQALAFARRFGDVRITIVTLTLLARIAFEQALPDRAGLLYGAITADHAYRRSTAAIPELERLLEPLQTSADPQLAAALDAGAHLSLENASALALTTEDKL